MRAFWLLAFLAGCAATPAPGTAAPAWPACFALELGPWDPSSPEALAVAHAPPAIVRLDTLRAPHAVDTAGRTRGPEIPKLVGRMGTPFWLREGRDSLELRWSSGYEGLFVNLRWQADSVRGIARTWTDYGAHARATVTGARVPCAGRTVPTG